MYCKICNKQLNAITNTHLKTHSTTQKEYIEKHGDIRSPEVKERMYTKERRLRLSKDMSRLRKEKVIVPWPVSEANRKAISQRMKANNPMKNKSISSKVWQKNKGKINNYWRGEEWSKKLSERMTNNNPMKDPAVVRKSWESRRHRKSSIEKFFEECTERIPSIKYVWNGKLWVGNKNPDYVVKGKSIVIEITSDAYHRLENWYEDKRVAHFNLHGYHCIIVRITRCNKQYKDKLKKDLFTLLQRLIHETNSYKVYHEKTGEIHCLQLRSKEQP